MSGKISRSAIAHDATESVSQAGAEPVPEQHYTVDEIAQRWNLSYEKVRRMFLEEEGVLRIGEASRLLGGRSKGYKRRYFLLRIPQHVLIRVEQQLMYKRGNEGVGLGQRLARDLHAS